MHRTVWPPNHRCNTMVSNNWSSCVGDMCLNLALLSWLGRRFTLSAVDLAFVAKSSSNNRGNRFWKKSSANGLKSLLRCFIRDFLRFTYRWSAVLPVSLMADSSGETSSLAVNIPSLLEKAKISTGPENPCWTAAALRGTCHRYRPTWEDHPTSVDEPHHTLGAENRKIASSVSHSWVVYLWLT